MSDVPEWLSKRARLISALAIALLVASAALLVLTDDESFWPLGVTYLSCAALGLDAVVRGVRKRAGVGPSIVNLAPGGWTIFAAMFWIVAVPAYFIGARRKVSEDFAREPVMLGSWIAIGVSALLGAALTCAPLVK